MLFQMQSWKNFVVLSVLLVLCIYTGLINPVQGKSFLLVGSPLADDEKPKVIGTSPVHGAQTVSSNDLIRFAFNMSVNISENGASVECPVGTSIALQGLPVSNSNFVELKPVVEFPFETLCQVKLLATNVTAALTPTLSIESDVIFTFTTTVAPPTPTIVPTALPPITAYLIHLPIVSR